MANGSRYELIDAMTKVKLQMHGQDKLRDLL